MNKTFAPAWQALALAALAPAAVHAAPLNADKPLVPGDEYLVVGNYPDNLHVVDLKTDSLYKTCAVPGRRCFLVCRGSGASSITG